MIPYWDTIEATSKAHNFFEVAGIVLFGVVVLAEVAAHVYGRRHDYLVKQSSDSQGAIIQRLQTELTAVQREGEPRHLSATQMREIVPEIRASGWKRAEIIWVGNGEPELYARNLAAAFEQAGVPVNVHTLGPFIPSAWGLLVVKTTNSDSTRLKEIFDRAGIASELALTNDTLGQKDWPTLVVGAREPAPPAQ